PPLSASSSPSAPRPPASPPWCSTAAAISSMAGSRPWPMPPARAGSPSRERPFMARTPGSSARPGGGGGARPGGGERPGGGRSGGRERGGRGRDGDRQQRGGEREDSDFVEKLVGINRVAKVVKGGRRF